MMKAEIIMEGDFMLELEEAEVLEVAWEEGTPLSITEKYGGVLTILCC